MYSSTFRPVPPWILLPSPRLYSGRGATTLYSLGPEVFFTTEDNVLYLIQRGRAYPLLTVPDTPSRIVVVPAPGDRDTMTKCEREAAFYGTGSYVPAVGGLVSLPGAREVMCDGRGNYEVKQCVEHYCHCVDRVTGERNWDGPEFMVWEPSPCRRGTCLCQTLFFE